MSKTTRPKTMGQLKPGDKVSIIRGARRGDRTSRATSTGRGEVLAVYPRFVLVQLPGWRECFWPEELRKVEQKGVVA